MKKKNKKEKKQPLSELLHLFLQTLSSLLNDKKSTMHEIRYRCSYIATVSKHFTEHHSQVKGILHDCLGSSKRRLTICNRYLLVQRARGTVFTNATKMCLFHLFRQTAIAAMF